MFRSVKFASSIDQRTINKKDEENTVKRQLKKDQSSSYIPMSGCAVANRTADGDV